MLNNKSSMGLKITSYRYNNVEYQKLTVTDGQSHLQGYELRLSEKRTKSLFQFQFILPIPTRHPSVVTDTSLVRMFYNTGQP